jgi:flagellar basal-body rod protein FlgC
MPLPIDPSFATTGAEWSVAPVEPTKGASETGSGFGDLLGKSLQSLRIAASGMSAERLRMDVTSANLANANSTRGANGQPYRRQEVVLQAAGGANSFSNVLQAAGAGSNSSPVLNGVQVAGIVDDPTPGRRVYDPGHPDADAQGYVTMPNVNTVTEMTDLIDAQRSYEANVTAMSAAKQMFSKTLEILR